MVKVVWTELSPLVRASRFVSCHQRSLPTRVRIPAHTGAPARGSGFCFNSEAGRLRRARQINYLCITIKTMETSGGRASGLIFLERKAPKPGCNAF